MTNALSIPSAMQTIATVRKDTLSAVQAAQAAGDTVLRDLTIAYGLKAMREAMTPEAVGVIAGLGGTALGWRHDMESKGGSYPPDVIRDCAIEALLRGLSLTGNNWNIIAARCYVTREGYSALLANYPGLTDLEIEIGLPEDGRPWGKQEMVFVTAAARCKVNGKPVSVECRKSDGFDGRLAVKTFSGEIDNAKGKAQRRLLKLLYERITGSTIDEPDDGVATAGHVTVVDPDAWKAPWQEEWRRLPESGPARDILTALMKCKSTTNVDAIMDTMPAQVTDARARETLVRAAEFMALRLMEQGE